MKYQRETRFSSGHIGILAGCRDKKDENIKDKISSVFTNDLVEKMADNPQVLQQLTDRGVTDFTPYDKFSPFSLGVGALNAAVQQVPVGILGAALSKLTGSEGLTRLSTCKLSN